MFESLLAQEVLPTELWFVLHFAHHCQHIHFCRLQHFHSYRYIRSVVQYLHWKGFKNDWHYFMKAQWPNFVSKEALDFVIIMNAFPAANILAYRCSIGWPIVLYSVAASLVKATLFSSPTSAPIQKALSAADTSVSSLQGTLLRHCKHVRKRQMLYRHIYITKIVQIAQNSFSPSLLLSGMIFLPGNLYGKVFQTL